MQRLLETEELDECAAVTINEQFVHRDWSVYDPMLGCLDACLKKLPHQSDRFGELELTASCVEQIAEGDEPFLIPRIIRNHTQTTGIVVSDTLDFEDVGQIETRCSQHTIEHAPAGNRIHDVIEAIEQMICPFTLMKHDEAIAPMNRCERAHGLIRPKSDTWSSFFMRLVYRSVVEQSLQLFLALEQQSP